MNGTKKLESLSTFISMSVKSFTAVYLLSILRNRNQAEFAELVPKTLDCLAQFKRLGNVELLLFYAYRNKAGNVVAYQRVIFVLLKVTVCHTLISVHSSTNKHPTFEEKYEPLFDEFSTQWDEFANEVLPSEFC